MTTEQATTEPQEGTRKRATGGIAYRGQPQDLTLYPPPSPLPMWPESTPEDEYIPANIDDFTDLNAATRELLRLRVLLHRSRRQLDAARRVEAEAAIHQRQHYARELISVSGGTEATRKAFAEIQNEAYLSRVLVTQAVAKEKMELSRTLVKEIEALKTICDNIRKQMSI